MRAESGMGRSRNLLTPWAQRKRNIGTVTFKSQTKPCPLPPRENCEHGSTSSNTYPSSVRHRQPAGRDVCLSGVGPEVVRLRSACVDLRWPALAHKPEVKKNVLHCELLCSSFFFRQKCNCRPDCQENWPDSINTWHHYFSSTHVFSLCGCRCEPAAASSWIIQWKYYKWPRAVIVQGNSEVSLVSLALFDDATLLLTGTPT